MILRKINIAAEGGIKNIKEGKCFFWPHPLFSTEMKSVKQHGQRLSYMKNFMESGGLVSFFLQILILYRGNGAVKNTMNSDRCINIRKALTNKSSKNKKYTGEHPSLNGCQSFSFWGVGRHLL